MHQGGGLVDLIGNVVHSRIKIQSLDFILMASLLPYTWNSAENRQAPLARASEPHRRIQLKSFEQLCDTKQWPSRTPCPRSKPAVEWPMIIETIPGINYENDYPNPRSVNIRNAKPQWRNRDADFVYWWMKPSNMIKLFWVTGEKFADWWRSGTRP